jgi:hypothetical protein
MVTNLGRVPFDTIFGRLRLKSLWGPAVLRGIEGEQTIGAATINGSLNLLHTSYTPLPALLMNIENWICSSCRQNHCSRAQDRRRSCGVSRGMSCSRQSS